MCLRHMWSTPAHRTHYPTDQRDSDIATLICRRGVSASSCRNLGLPLCDASGVELILRVFGAEAVGESRSLLARLRADDVRGLRVSLDRAPTAPDEMGTLDDTLRAVFDPAVIAAVAGAVATWLTTRRRAVELHLRHGERELKLSAGSPNDARRLLGEIEGLLAPPEAADTPRSAPADEPE